MDEKTKAAYDQSNDLFERAGKATSQKQRKMLLGLANERNAEFLRKWDATHEDIETDVTNEAATTANK